MNNAFEIIELDVCDVAEAFKRVKMDVIGRRYVYHDSDFTIYLVSTRMECRGDGDVKWIYQFNLVY